MSRTFTQVGQENFVNFLYGFVHDNLRDIHFLKSAIKVAQGSDLMTYTVTEQATLSGHTETYSFTPDDFEYKSERSKSGHISKGTILIREGETSTNMYFLVKGQLKVFKEGIHINTINPNEIFGELAYAMDVERTATVMASEDSIVLSFCAANIDQELEGLHEWMQSFIKGLMRKIIHLSELVAKGSQK